MFATSTILSLFVGGLLTIIIPLAAAVIFKLKNRETWLPSAFIGAGTFLLFAMILETLLHQVMLPLVQGSTVLYCAYGALAAGVFEETGRFVAYKTLMKRHYTTKNAVYLGIGHGGFEAIILGVNLVSRGAALLSANALGFDEFIQMSANGNAELADTLRQQLESFQSYNFASVGAGIYERLIAMTFHVCLSVVVYKAVSQKGKLWLYPLAVLLHAALDTFAALHQRGVITSVLLLYVIFTVFVAAVVFGTVVLAKKMPDSAAQ